eukprot:345140-Chlamydomonas_euryale.AAC.3
MLPALNRRLHRVSNKAGVCTGCRTRQAFAPGVEQGRRLHQVSNKAGGTALDKKACVWYTMLDVYGVRRLYLSSLCHCDMCMAVNGGREETDSVTEHREHRAPQSIKQRDRAQRAQSTTEHQTA